MYIEIENSENENRLRPTDKKILDNFYWSFHHSQGDPTLQRYLMLYVARKFNTEEIGSLPELQARLNPFIAKMSIPPQHTQNIDFSIKIKPITHEDAQKARGGFQMEWRGLQLTLNRVLNNEPPLGKNVPMSSFGRQLYDAEKLSHHQLMYEIATEISEQDIVFQNKKRQNRQNKADPHESHLKTYSIDGLSAQTQEYDDLYGEIRILLKRVGIGINGDSNDTDDKIDLYKYQKAKIKRKISVLKKRWEENHPSGKFFTR